MIHFRLFILFKEGVIDLLFGVFSGQKVTYIKNTLKRFSSRFFTNYFLSVRLLCYTFYKYRANDYLRTLIISVFNIRSLTINHHFVLIEKSLTLWRSLVKYTKTWTQQTFS